MVALQDSALILDIEDSLVGKTFYSAANSLLEEKISVYQSPEDFNKNAEKHSNLLYLSDRYPYPDDEDKKDGLYEIFLLRGREGEIKVKVLRVFHAPLRLGQIFDDMLNELLFKQAENKRTWPEELKIGLYRLLPATGALLNDKNEVVVTLTEKERDILCFLHENKDRPVSRQELLDFVWNFAGGVETHTLETHIYRVRQKIETDPAHPRFLMTENEGYRLIIN